MDGDWLLDPTITFLNHGSFGACPRPVLDAQQAFRERMEADPVRFMTVELEPALDASRAELARFLGARTDDLAFVPNATTGVNTVLRSLAPTLRPGDEIVATDHEYNAVLNAIRWLCRATGARLVMARIPFPIGHPDEASAAILDAVTDRTRLAVMSHVTSATAIVLPIDRIVAELREVGVESLVDAAHAPGMVPVDLERTGAAYTTGNGHKWICAPKGSGFLHVRADRRDAISPLVVSHGANAPLAGRSRFHRGFDWTGTGDNTPYLVIGNALRYMATSHPDGWPGLMAANHQMALAGRDVVAAALAVDRPAPDDMLGSMAVLPVPDDLDPVPVLTQGVEGADPDESVAEDPLHDELIETHRIQVPVYRWPPNRDPGRPPMRLLRLSAQRYNTIDDYERLAAVFSSMRARASD